MCGIAGLFLREGSADLATVRRMCDSIRHRGPDDEGFHLDGACGIGIRRLRIIDLSTGHQPIANVPLGAFLSGGIDSSSVVASMALQSSEPVKTFSIGFQESDVPLAVWFRGPLRALVWDHLTGSRFLNRGLVSSEFVRSLLEEHQRERRDNHHWLWSLPMLELWFHNLEQSRS